MNKLQRTCIGFALACLLTAGMLLLAGCNGYHRSYGPQLTELGRVADLPYVPAGHGTGIGLSTSGSMVATSTHIPARYAIVFECPHGRFVVEGHPQLWKQLRVGMAVDIHYREILEGTDSVPDHVVGLDFLGATARGIEK